MKKLIAAAVIPLALAAAGCDRKTDAPKPRTGIAQPTAPASAGQMNPKRARLVRI